MADPNEFDDVMPENTAHKVPPPKGIQEGLLARLVSSVVIWFMISLSQTIIGVVTLVQFLFLVINNKQPNERLANFGEDVGIWMAKAARYQAGASEVKPWPWTELD